MNFSEQIINVLNEVTNKFGLAIDWTSSNVLPYAKELGDRIVKYEVNTSMIWIIIYLIFIALCSTAIYFDIKYDATDLFISLIASMLIIACFVLITIQVFDIVEAITIPEKTILEYINIYINRR